jgi:hypothetical protein
VCFREGYQPKATTSLSNLKRRSRCVNQNKERAYSWQKSEPTAGECSVNQNKERAYSWQKSEPTAGEGSVNQNKERAYSWQKSEPTAGDTKG